MEAELTSRPITLVRQLRADDADRLDAFIEGLTQQSRRQHFLGPKRGLTRRERVALTDIDHVDHEALAAIDETTGRIVGIARYARTAIGHGDAEFAIAVADSWQRQGLGRALSERLFLRARDNGIERLRAATLWDNHASKALLTRLGFRVCGASQGVLELAVELRCRQAA
jgi:acetyltransferase